MKNKKIKTFLIWAVSIIVVALVLYYVVVDPLLDYIYLKQNSAYTISNSISFGTPNKAGNQSKYTFYLNGKWYAGFTSLPLKWDGTKYFIEFYPKNPNRNKATTVIATDDDIKNMPVEGYKKLPHE